MSKKKHQGIEKMARNKYRIRVRGKDPRTGKLKEVDRVVENISLSDAVRLREEWREELRNGDVEEQKERITVRAYAKSWLTIRLPRLKPSTAQHYAGVLDLHILPAFGDLYFDALTKKDVDEWVAAQDGKYRPETINSRIRVLRSLCGDAAADLGINNPTARLRALPTRMVEDMREALDPDELARLLAAVKEMAPAQFALLLTLALTGMRWGEASALKWGDIHEKDCVISMIRGHRHRYVSSPKNNRPRVHPLTPELLAALKEHRQILEEQQHPGLKEGWIFATRSKRDSDKASLRTPSSWSKSLPKWLEAAEINKHITPHSFRRTNVDLLRRAKVDAVVAKSLVGHTTESMRERYSTVATEEQREAATKIGDLINQAHANAPKEDPPCTR